jgi:hypothetical protein
MSLPTILHLRRSSLTLFLVPVMSLSSLCPPYPRPSNLQSIPSWWSSTNTMWKFYTEAMSRTIFVSNTTYLGQSRRLRLFLPLGSTIRHRIGSTKNLTYPCLLGLPPTSQLLVNALLPRILHPSFQQHVPC